MPSPHDDYYSTAYHGSQGHIDDRSLLSLDLDRDGYDALQLPEPAKAATPSRPALSARLMSSWSSAQPAAAALSRKGSVLHSRAKSLAGYMPKLNSNIAAATPEKPKEGQQRQSALSNLFSGESAPIKLGVPQSPTKEKEETEFVMEYKPSFTERPTAARRRSTAYSQTSSSTTSPSAKTGWFGRKSTAPVTAPSRILEEQDELLALNINTALFLHGPAAPLSPHAFNDLLLNATALLTRMQTAYKEKVEYIASIQPEIDAQREEVEEAETRAQHLKFQLEELSRKSEEQNQAMREMAAMLAEEKMKNAEGRNVRLVRRGSAEETEDEVTPRRAKRSSGGSGSDSGFESDVDYADSIVSGGRETPSMVLTPAYDGQEWDLGTSSLGYHGLRNDRSAVQISRTNMRDLSGTTIFSTRRAGSGGSGDGVAWDTVDALRGENRDLKRRVEGMEREMQGVIDLVGASIRG